MPGCKRATYARVRIRAFQTLQAQRSLQALQALGSRMRALQARTQAQERPKPRQSAPPTSKRVQGERSERAHADLLGL